MGKKWTDVKLHRHSILLGEFERTIVVPKICCRCLSTATEEKAIETVFPDPYEEQKTWTISVKFPYCEKLRKGNRSTREYRLSYISTNSFLRFVLVLFPHLAGASPYYC